MRLVPFAAALGLMALPALAQTTPPAAPPTKPVPASAATNHHRMTMQERFNKANTSHDGHLTLVQAKAGYPTVARHFAEIDAAKKGYITEDQIRAWEKAERDRRHAGQTAQGTTPKS